jgi:glycosyltransferase involved in cell wall biosynthesis
MGPALRPVLLLAFYFPPEPASGSARPWRFFKYLPEFGYAPHVLTAAPQPEPHPNIHYVPATTMYPNKYTLAGATEIALHKLALPTELALLWAAAASRSARRIIGQNPPAAIISTAPPLNTHLAALWLKRRHKIAWIADFRDPLVGNSYREVGGVRSRAADKLLESLIFRFADVVISATDVVADAWRIRHSRYARKVRLLWNGFDPGEALCAAAVPERPYRTLAHVGRLYGMRHPMTLLYSLQRLIASGRLAPGALRVQLVGGIEGDAPCDASAIEWLRERNSLEILPYMARRDALRYMTSADYLLLLDLHQNDQAYAVPAKLYEYIRVGRPMLIMTHPGAPVDRIAARSGIPHICVYPHDDDARVDAKLLELTALPPDPAPPSEWFIETFDGRRQTAALARILDSVVCGAHSDAPAEAAPVSG